VSILDDNISLEDHARRVSRLVWDNDASVKEIRDPRKSAFAAAIVEAFGAELGKTSALIQQVISGAASAAEDLNVEPYQGLVEILQNADDLGAKEVRFAFRQSGEIPRSWARRPRSPTHV
jgi:hypothetical protein